jgi:hypothetical protein
MNHLNEEQLIALYYSEDGPESARHLEGCGQCARAYEALQADLADVGSFDPPSRGADHGEQVWRSIEGRLPIYAGQPKAWYRRGLWIGLSSAAACALLVAAAFYAGRLWEHRQPQHLTAAHPAVPVPQERVVVVVLSDHLDRSERFLVELKHAKADDTELTLPLRDEARSLLVANRTARQDAAQTGDPALTKALDRLNELLNALANHPGGLNAAAIARLQDEMNADGLLFEVRVLRSRIPHRKAATDPRLKGGIA